MDNNTQKDKLKKRIIYNEDIFTNTENYEMVLDDLLEDSKYIALSTLFPYDDYSAIELPTMYNNWQIRACIELYNMADKSIYKSYSENGINFSKDSDGLSNSLMSELIPKVGIPKRINIEETEEQNV